MSKKKPIKRNLNSELIERIHVEKTPFTLIRTDKKWHITTVKYRCMKEYKSKEECINAINNPTWELLMIAIQTMIDINKPLINNSKIDNSAKQVD